MVLIGMLGAMGFVLLTIGLRTTPASAFAIVDYMNILWAALFGFVFFSEVPELRFWIGGALIIAACVLGAWSASRRPETPAAP
jgi:S-adenosylmethionine uptake transporter